LFFSINEEEIVYTWFIYFSCIKILNNLRIRLKILLFISIIMGFDKDNKETETNSTSSNINETRKIVYIYESPDNGETVYRRPFGSHDVLNRERIK